MDSIESYLAKYPSLIYNDTKTKIICEWTKHEMPLKVEALQTYINGNKYKNLLASKINNDLLKKYSEFLVPSNKPKRENQLFCKLTLKHLNKQADHIQQHVTGRKFLKAHKHWLHCQETNQTFVPFSKQYKVKERDLENGSDIGEDDDSDNMSDLFPEEMFDLIDNEDNNESNEEKSMSCDEDDKKESNGHSNIKSLEQNIDKKLNLNKRKFDMKPNKKQKNAEPQKKKSPKIKILIKNMN